MDWIENKRVVVTGATSGIGKNVAAGLAALGADVVLACRDRARAEKVASDINAGTGRRSATVMAVDTSDQRSIRAFAAEYRDAHGRLDVLVNNAGVLLTDRQTSVDNIELTFATNVLGYHLVARELLPALEASAPARIVNVVSTWASAPDLDDLQFERRSYDGFAAYAESKACDRLLTWALARRLRPELVTVNAVAPGLVLETGLYRHLRPNVRREFEQRELERSGSRTAAQGADTVVWLASSGYLEGVSGRFFEKRAGIDCEFRDETTEERIWDACETLTRPLVAR
jgi:NAD(P)-dependent dehydrogenase (short-subunit alcohol dehydrogenase family)